ncbi:hypothetical protein E8L99_23495 [Phreatobacter aquaticus]|uniref:DUF1795 domain-containing protein n=1 Tax=Phreatobacter aquaticus TaxID=2570229 RepID=A0A4D7QXB8_9HYPH|nr:hypothetical protein [Phreatobacter aquaticus]QCK88512.1 hypothetical protein E8L99_23495 [Phreatobacter aquaticus]
MREFALGELGMRLPPFVLALLVAAAPAFAQVPSFDPPTLPQNCASGTEPCPMLDFTRQALAPALDGVVLSIVRGQPALFSATSRDPALPSFVLTWFEEPRPMPASQIVEGFLQAIRRPGETCAHRPHGQPTAVGLMFVLSCRVTATGVGRQLFFFIASGRQRAGGFAIMGSVDQSKALIARGERMAQALTQVALRVQGGGGQPVQPQVAPPVPQAQAAPPATVVPPRPQQAQAPSFDPPPLPPLCTAGTEPCPLLDFTRRALAPALNGVTLVIVPGQVALFDATTTDPALPDFSLVWFEQSPPIAPNLVLTQTTNAIRQPGEFCVDRPHGQPNAIGQMFVMSCATVTSGAGSQLFFFIAGGQQRTGGFTLLGTLANGPALIARGERMVQALTQVALQGQGGGGQPVQPQVTPPRPQQTQAGGQVPNTGRFTGQPAAAPIAQATPQTPPNARPAAPAASASPPPEVRIQTVRGLMRDKPFSLSYPDEFQQKGSGSELFLDHSRALFQVSLKIAPAAAGASAQAAARGPAAQVAAADRAAFADFSLEHRSLVILPAGPTHIYVATMTSPMGDRPRLRMVVAELFSEGRRYELAFTTGEDVFATAGNAIGFMLANFAPTNAPRTCCAEPVSLPW